MEATQAREGKRWVLEKEKSKCYFDKSVEPALRVDEGDIIRLETSDEAYYRLSQGESAGDIQFSNFNRVTGPIYVNGARKGDSLRVDILDIEIIRAWSVWIPGYGPFGDHTEEPDVFEVKIEEIENGRTYLSAIVQPSSEQGIKAKVGRISERLTVPIRPMIGCIGVAPAKKTASTLAPVYSIGGNMDLRELEAGASIFLPVEVEGGLLSIGDIHAAMGTGEPAVVAYESSAFVTVRVSIDRTLHLEYPRLRVGDDVICLAVAATWERARGLALEFAWKMLIEEYKMTKSEAFSYASSSVSLRFGGPAAHIVLAVVPEPRFSAGGEKLC